ncbi:DUF362 domain-containing protein [Romboutsia sp. Marseille-P6047]|uniref:DUF362 domain-containing protein n=1 Tax=Romboutsia sp. Marseille-P6047 TaxID=2161817 RepID=UPI000F052445|nr:DUF362 domain-containing protein [Romboutsia sp. Marseille-P6047]
MVKSKVYFTKEITSNSLIEIYKAMGVTLKGKVAVKISTGEPGGHNFLEPNLIKDLVNKLNGTIVECNTAYPGGRNESNVHWETIEKHGFKAISPCDILDEDGDMTILVKCGKNLRENYVGNHLQNYDSMLILSHFKGHAMGGFGGALKNMSIGLGSSRGKLHIHTSGEGGNFEDMFTADHDSFLESMADADKSVMDFMGRENIVYINVANKLSVDCDCDANPDEPKMADIGILASTDPVALDQASVDLVYQSKDPGKSYLIERMESRNGIHTVISAESLGLGFREYELINID